MGNRLFLFVVILLAFSTLKAQEKYSPEWESIAGYEVPAWFRDAKFGIFIHWGVYAVPAYKNEWYPRNIWIRKL